MKRSTPRQVAAQLSELKHLARCSALRAAAASSGADAQGAGKEGVPTGVRADDARTVLPHKPGSGESHA
jgi:hypothetical protein